MCHCPYLMKLPNSSITFDPHFVNVNFLSAKQQQEQERWVPVHYNMSNLVTFGLVTGLSIRTDIFSE